MKPKRISISSDQRLEVRHRAKRINILEGSRNLNEQKKKQVFVCSTPQFYHREQHLDISF